MNKLIIYEYINRLRREDIVKFCNIKGIQVNDMDIDTLYWYVKNEYKSFFNNPEEVLYEIKGKISDNAFREIIKYYDKYKYMIR